MFLNDLIDDKALGEAIANDLVYVATNESGYGILSYTRKAMFENIWNEVTCNARGLIFDLKTKEIVGRPWEKFFNYGQVEGVISMEEKVEVTDKMDGSLLVSYRDRDGVVRVSTRGSFTSEMAQHCTPILNENGLQDLPKGVTALFEAIYPENRIVLDYDGLDNAFLLGGVVIETGEVLSPNDDRLSFYKGPRTQVFGYETLREALKRKPRKNAEGIVVRSLETGKILKIKQEDYVALHKMLHGLTPVKIWEVLKTEGSFGRDSTVLGSFPDEVFDEVRACADKMIAQSNEVLSELSQKAQALTLEMLAEGLESKRDRAIFLKSKGVGGAVFAHLVTGKDKPLLKEAWDSVRPTGQKAL